MRLLRALFSWFAANIFFRPRHEAPASEIRQDNPAQQDAAVVQHAVRLEIQIDPAIAGQYRRDQNQRDCRDKLRLWLEGATLVAVLVYAWITYGLFQSSEKVLTETRQHNERTSRAYVLVPRIDLVREPTPLIKEPNALVPSWGVRISLHNFGKTPAGITESGVLIVGYPPDPPIPRGPDGCPTNYPTKVGSNILVPPENERAFYLHGDPFHTLMEWVMKDRLKRGLTVYGRLEYVDAFKKRRGPMKFCYHLLSAFMTPDNAKRYIYGRDKPDRSAFTQCDPCNSWEEQ